MGSPNNSLPFSEADLDAIDAQDRGAPLRPPISAEVDLFGNPLVVHPDRRIKGVRARTELKRYRMRLFRAGIDPLDVMARCMIRAFEDGDYETAHKRAADLAPYMAPRLNAVAVAAPGGGVGPSGGELRVRWESDGDTVEGAA